MNLADGERKYNTLEVCLKWPTLQCIAVALYNTAESADLNFVISRATFPQCSVTTFESHLRSNEHFGKLFGSQSNIMEYCVNNPVTVKQRALTADSICRGRLTQKAERSHASSIRLQDNAATDKT